MPHDYKRNNGPEISTPYRHFTKNFVKNYDQLYADLFDKKGARKEREFGEARSVFVKTQVVSQAKGSSYIEMQNTKVICSVFDPREIPNRNEFSDVGELFCEVKFATFSCQNIRRSHVPDSEEKALAESLKRALETGVCRYMFPNFQVDIFVLILENDGACLSAAINAACLALVDAAVPMYHLVTATTIAVRGNNIFVDPNELEEQVSLYNKSLDDENHGVLTVAFIQNLEQVTEISQAGSMDVDCVAEVLGVGKIVCDKVAEILQQHLLKSTKRGVEERNQKEKQEAERMSMWELNTMKASITSKEPATI